MKIQKADENITIYKFDKLHSLDCVHTLHISDVHYDSLKCKRDMLKKHLDEIKRANGYVFVYGDWFDVMGCYKDPRTKSKDIDPRYLEKGREYLNSVVEDSIEFLKPYAKNIAFISEGNHETEIKKRRDVDILEWMVNALNAEGGQIVKGHYSGWNEFVFESGTKTVSVLTHYHHGYGGNAKRSKGMLDSQIAAFTYPDADIIFRGHTHQKFHDPSNVKWKYNKSWKRAELVNSHYICTGSYKDGVGKGLEGWEVQKGFLPSRLGGWNIDFQIKVARGKMTINKIIREANG